MNTAACLILYGLAVVWLGPQPLVRLTGSGVAPRLGVAVWLTAIASVIVSWVAAAGFLMAELIRDWNRPDRSLIGACLAVLRDVAAGRYGVLVQLGLAVLAAFAAAVVVVLAWRLVGSLLRARCRTHEHARLARIVGRRVPGLDAVVVDAPERVVYCVAGRPHAVVVSSAVIETLGPDHLNAVLSHERAHLGGRHHLVLAATRGLATVMPGIGLFRVGAREVARLVEMCADDSAVRAHGSEALLGALLALTGSAPAPVGTMGAASVAAVARAERLATPPCGAQRLRTRVLLGVAGSILAMGPVAVGVAATTGLAMCASLW